MPMWAVASTEHGPPAVGSRSHCARRPQPTELAAALSASLDRFSLIHESTAAGVAGALRRLIQRSHTVNSVSSPSAGTGGACSVR